MNHVSKSAMILLLTIFACGSAIAQISMSDGNYSEHVKLASGVEGEVDGYSESDGTGFNSGILYQDELGEEGEIFYEGGWQKGEVMLASGKTMVPDKLCYNLYFRQMQFISGKDTLAFAEPAELSWLKLGEDTFVFTDYVENGEVLHDYFQVLNKGNCRLLKRHVITHHKEIDPHLGTSEKDQFFRACELYVQKEGEPAQKVRCSKKSLCRVLDEQEEILMDYIKKNDIRIRTSEDLITVLDYYNSLETLQMTAIKQARK